MRHFKYALWILTISTVAAAVGNQMRSPPLPWIREPLPLAKAAPAPPTGTSITATSQAAAEAGFVLIDEVITRLKDQSAHFVDARAKEEYVKGHLRGAINLPSETIYQEHKIVTEVIPAIEKMIVYCGGGECEASHNVADALRRDFGYTDVSIYKKGWEEIAASKQRFAGMVVTGDSP